MFDELLEELLREGHAARFVADGDSMHPTIRAGDSLEIVRVPPETLRRGDVILTRAPRGLTAHRIVGIGPHAVTTRGDNALETDSPVPLEAILGRVAAIHRGNATLDPGLPPSRAAVLLRHGARAVLRVLRRNREG